MLAEGVKRTVAKYHGDPTHTYGDLSEKKQTNIARPLKFILVAQKLYDLIYSLHETAFLMITP